MLCVVDCLQGVTIFNSKLFTVCGDQAHSFIWEGFGFELHSPKGTCLPDEECDVMIDAVVSGDFLFPREVEPVSTIYIISIASKLCEPTLLRIQHCVALNEASEHSQLSFYRATLKEPTPPYHFECAKGGRFDTGNQYGLLELPVVFCAVAIGKESDEDITDSNGVGREIEQESSVGVSKEPKHAGIYIV